MGYVEETCAAQYLRDARSTTIYEGTTGIQANDLLGRPHRMRGIVVHGAGRGAGLGFPTANIDAIDTIIPHDGVYAAHAFVDGQGPARPSAVHIGPNVTFGEQILLGLILSGSLGERIVKGAFLLVDQSRKGVAAARRGICDPQSYTAGGAHQAGDGQQVEDGKH